MVDAVAVTTETGVNGLSVVVVSLLVSRYMNAAAPSPAGPVLLAADGRPVSVIMPGVGVVVVSARVSPNFGVLLATPSDSIIKSISDRWTGKFCGKFRILRGNFLLRFLSAEPLATEYEVPVEYLEGCTSRGAPTGLPPASAAVVAAVVVVVAENDFVNNFAFFLPVVTFFGTGSVIYFR